MKNKPYLAILLSTSLVVSILGTGYRLETDDKWSNTLTTPVLEAKIIPGKNVVYCSTFQIAWNEAMDKVFHGKMNSANNPQLTDLLNKKTDVKRNISSNCYYLTVGNGQQTISRINRDLKAKFGDGAPPEIREDMTDDDIIIFAYLYKFLEFAYPFNQIEGGFWFGDAGSRKKCRMFGICGYRPAEHANIGSQVRIIDYKGDDDFIVRLSEKTGKDEIILAKVPPGRTLSGMVEAVELRIGKSTPESLKHADNLFIPEAAFDIPCRFKDLEFGGIEKAFQRNAFSFNRKGASLKSEARIIYKDGGHERNFIFDKPFLLCLKEKGSKRPYLAVWVANPELLVKQK
jgi:hypothetical protein